MRARAPLSALLLGALLGCARPGSPPSPSASTSPPTSLSAVSSSSPAEVAELAPPPPPGPWRESLRAGRLRDAASQIDALPEEERKRPDMRLVRARVALDLGDHRLASSLLEGLDLPLVSGLISRLRAESALEAGPHEAAAAYYSARGGARNLAKAALAYERAGKIDEARRALDRAVASSKGGATEAQARAQRMKLAEAQGAREAAVADARWIFLQSPESPHAKAAAEALTRLEPAYKPSAQERLARVERLAQAGRADDCSAELEALSASPGKLSELDLLRARGNALYKLRRYAEAAEALGRAAQRGGSIDDAFQAARALSRANRDDEAVKAYREIVKKSPKSPVADEASYLAARLLMLLGRADDAVDAYGKYLKAFRAPKHRAAALQELGLVEMSRKRFGKARAVFGTLAREEDNRAEAARLRELEGLAAMRAGDAQGAASVFVEVVKSQPLSFPALVARERLAELKVSPPPLEPAESGEPAPLSIKLPSDADFLHRLGLEDDAEEAMRPAERSLSQGAGGRGAEVLCAAYGLLDPAGRRFRIGQDQVKVDLVMKAPGASNRWAWDCLYPRPYPDLVREAEQREGLPPGILHAVMRQESAFDPDVVSPALAVGLLQLLPSTAKEIAARNQVPFEDGSLVRPAVNVDLGARYLAMLLKMWKGNVPLAVASYNAGPKAVSRWLEHAGPTDVDLFVARIPYGETRHYVARVLGNHARYALLSGGPEAVPRIPLGIDPSLRADEGAF